MKILDTNWHIGRSLCGRERHEELAALLAWLAVGAIQQYDVDDQTDDSLAARERIKSLKLLLQEIVPEMS